MKKYLLYVIAVIFCSCLLVSIISTADTPCVKKFASDTVEKKQISDLKNQVKTGKSISDKQIAKNKALANAHQDAMKMVNTSKIEDK